jgi:sugar phosphate isomerase/epimerase
MKLGISSPAFSNDDFESRLESVTQHFTLWEIVADLKQFLPDIRDKLTALAPSYDIEFAIHAPFNDLNIAAFNPEIRKISFRIIKECMTASHELGFRNFSFHPGHYCPAGIYAVDKVHELSKTGVLELAEFGKDLDLDLSLENMPIPNWTLCTTKDELMGYIEGTELNICFDVGHANINEQIFEFMSVKEKFGNIHIHDNNGSRDQHLVLGQGTVPFHKFLPDLKSTYKNNIIIEANNLKDGIESYGILQKMLE